MWIIAIVAIAIVVYLIATHSGKQMATSSEDEVLATSTVTIMVPNDLQAYKKAMTEFIQVSGGVNPSKTWPFVVRTVTVSATTDVVRTTAEAAAEYIPTQAGTSSLVVYFKVMNGTAYVLLNMDIDGWAGVSAAIAQVHPIVEKTLLQFPQIKEVQFQPAQGDYIDQGKVIESNRDDDAVTIIEPSFNAMWKIGEMSRIRWITKLPVDQPGYILLMNGDKQVIAIASSTALNGGKSSQFGGSKNFIPPNSIMPGTGYYVRIGTNYDNGSGYPMDRFDSVKFTITN